RRPRHHPYLHSFPTRRSSDLPLDLVEEPAEDLVVDDVPTLAAVELGGVHAAERVPDLHGDPGLDQAAARVGDDDRVRPLRPVVRDRKSTRLNSSHVAISYAVF